jgi:hypothetical protein
LGGEEGRAGNVAVSIVIQSNTTKHQLGEPTPCSMRTSPGETGLCVASGLARLTDADGPQS